MAAMPSPFDALVGAPLNHLLRANRWARESLKPYSGKTVSVRCPPFSASLRIVDSGEVTPAAAGATPDATLSVTPGLLLRMATRDDTAWRDITIEGDTALAGAVHHLWRHLRWDAEEDLSRVFGDIAAHRITGTAQAMGQWARMSGENLVRSFTEYWTEERRTVAATNDLSSFATEVDLLRDDLARLEKRISRLATR
jgi:ubiquinone biosynthesis protein UbiJ